MLATDQSAGPSGNAKWPIGAADTSQQATGLEQSAMKASGLVVAVAGAEAADCGAVAVAVAQWLTGAVADCLLSAAVGLWQIVCRWLSGG